MATTFELIQAYTVGGAGQANIDFTSIPSTFTDLCLVVSLRTNRSSPDTEDSAKLTFNNSTTNYSSRWIRGSGTGATSSTGGTDAIFPIQANAGGSTASTFNNASIYIPNYRGSTYKSVSIDTVQENNATAAFMNLSAGLWSDTSAITSVKLTPNVGTAFVQYSTAYLYGVKNA